MLTELIGNVFTLKHTVKDATGTPVNPATVTFTVKSPTGAVTTGPYTRRPITGSFEFDYEPTVALKHIGEVVTTGPDSAASCEFFVLPSPVV